MDAIQGFVDFVPSPNSEAISVSKIQTEEKGQLEGFGSEKMDYVGNDLSRTAFVNEITRTFSSSVKSGNQFLSILCSKYSLPLPLFLISSGRISSNIWLRISPMPISISPKPGINFDTAHVFPSFSLKAYQNGRKSIWGRFPILDGELPHFLASYHVPSGRKSYPGQYENFPSVF